MLFKELYSSPLCYQYSTKPLRNQFLTNPSCNQYHINIYQDGQGEGSGDGEAAFSQWAFADEKGLQNWTWYPQ